MSAMLQTLVQTMLLWLIVFNTMLSNPVYGMSKQHALNGIDLVKTNKPNAASSTGAVVEKRPCSVYILPAETLVYKWTSLSFIKAAYKSMFN